MIYLYPTYILIEDYKPGDCKSLESSLSVWDKVCHRYDFSAFLVDEETNRMIIPGGYPIDKLYKYFPNKKIIDYKNRIHEFRTVDRYALTSKPRNSLQNEAIQFLIGQKNNTYPQKYLALPTGKGKTYCVINYLFRTRKLPLIIVDKESLLQQWIESIMRFTSILENEIYIIKGKKSVNELMNMTEKELSKYKYFIGIHRTFSNMFSENMDSITELFDKLKIGVKVFDEAHIEYYNIFYMNCCTYCETIYLSATPERSDPNENKVYKNMFSEVPLFKPDISDKYVNIIQYSINSKCNPNQLIKFKSNRGFNVIAYSKYSVTKSTFKDSIIDLLPKIFNNDFKQDKKIAIVLKMLEHIDMMEEIINEFLEDKEHNLTIGKLTGNTKNKAEVKQKNIILTTDSSFTKGEDVSNLSVLINYVPIGTVPKLNQMIGRLRKIEGTNVFFVDIIDESVPDIVKQNKIRLRYYKKVASKIYSMKLKSDGDI